MINSHLTTIIILIKIECSFLQIDAEAKPLTNQKSSGRCWLFAALNVIRLPVIKHFNLEDFEFSQGYLFYWDKIERCNFFLHNIVETAKRNEPVDSRLVSFLLYVSWLACKLNRKLIIEVYAGSNL